MVDCTEIPHISDALWLRVGAVIERYERERTAEEIDSYRLVIDALLYRAITGETWQDCLVEWPQDADVSGTFLRWRRSGALRTLSKTMLVALDDSDC